MQKAGILLALATGMAWQALSAQETVRPKYERDIITRAEIRDRAPDAKTAYDVVQRLRPQFLRERSSGSISSPLTAEGNRSTAAERQPVQVYVNGARSSIPKISLRELPADGVIDILYLNASDATTRFGTGHDNGAIVVRTGA